MAIHWRLRRAGEVAALAAAAVPAVALVAAAMAGLALVVVVYAPLWFAHYIVAYAAHGERTCDRPRCLVCSIGGPSLDPDPRTP